MRKGAIQGRTEFEGRNWVRGRKRRKKPCGERKSAGVRGEGCREEPLFSITERDLAGLRREMAREELDLTAT